MPLWTTVGRAGEAGYGFARTLPCGTLHRMARTLFILGAVLLVFGVFTGLLGLAGFLIHLLHSDAADGHVPVGLAEGLVQPSVIVGLGTLCLLLSHLLQKPPAPAGGSPPPAEHLRAIEDILAAHRAENYDAVARRLRELDDRLAELGEYLAADPPPENAPPAKLQELFDRARAVRELYP